MPPFSFGSGTWPTVVPVVGDWDGDGADTVGVKAGTTWSLSNSNTTPSVALTFTYGLANDLPLSWR